MCMENKKKKTALLVIDMQNDFCDKENGTLYVEGADNDLYSLISFIITDCEVIDDIILTQDSHNPYSIFFTSWWRTEEGKEVKPYTVVTLKDVEDGKYIPRHLSNNDKFGSIGVKWELEYLKKIEENGKSLILWPDHCINGSVGEALPVSLTDVLEIWSNDKEDTYNIVKKGSCPWSEQYSAFDTLVEVSTYPSTKANIGLMETLDTKYDRVYVAGEAMNYCVKETLASIIKLRPSLVKKLVILTDCMSAIGDFDINEDEVFKKLLEMGAIITKSGTESFNNMLNGYWSVADPFTLKVQHFHPLASTEGISQDKIIIYSVIETGGEGCMLNTKEEIDNYLDEDPNAQVFALINDEDWNEFKPKDDEI